MTKAFALVVLLGSVALSLGYFPPASAAIYKWVDEHGKVHYGDKPPAGNATEMDIEQSGGSGPSLTDTQRKAKQQRLLDAFEKEREEKEAAEAQAKQEKKDREAWCKKAREELAELRAAGYLYDYDEDGNKVVFSDEQRTKATKKYEDEIAKHC